MMDPRSLSSQGLGRFEPGEVEAVDRYDTDEPLLLESLTLAAGDLEALTEFPVAFDRCVIAGADLSLVEVCGIKNSLVRDSKLRGTVFANYVRNVVFESCQLVECAMRMMTLDLVVFAQCQLDGCDFYGSALSKAAFPGSTVAGVGFDACVIDDVDLSDAADLHIGDPRTLRGTRIRETQVPLLALRLAELSGIEILDG